MHSTLDLTAGGSLGRNGAGGWGTLVPLYVSYICAAPKGMVFGPFQSEHGYRFQPFWSGIGYVLPASLKEGVRSETRSPLTVPWRDPGNEVGSEIG